MAIRCELPLVREVDRLTHAAAVTLRAPLRLDLVGADCR